MILATSAAHLLVEYLFLRNIFQWLLQKVTLHEQKGIICQPERNDCDNRSNKINFVRYWLLFHYEFKKIARQLSNIFILQ